MPILTETSLARIHKHSMDRNIGMISAFRKAYGLKENLERTKQLEAKIRANNLAFIKLKGRYIEGYGTKGQKDPSDEVSLLVIGSNSDDGGFLKGLMKKLGREFNQDSILFKPYDDEKAVLIGTNEANEFGEPTWPGLNNVVSIGKFHPMKAGEFHTVMTQTQPEKLLKKDLEKTPKKTLPSDPKTFTFESYEVEKSFFEAWGDFLQRKMGNITLLQDK